MYRFDQRAISTITFQSSLCIAPKHLYFPNIEDPIQTLLVQVFHPAIDSQ